MTLLPAPAGKIYQDDGSEFGQTLLKEGFATVAAWATGTIGVTKLGTKATVSGGIVDRTRTSTENAVLAWGWGVLLGAPTLAEAYRRGDRQPSQELPSRA
jgi:hypothetical protein